MKVISLVYIYNYPLVNNNNNTETTQMSSAFASLGVLTLDCITQLQISLFAYLFTYTKCFLLPLRIILSACQKSITRNPQAHCVQNVLALTSDNFLWYSVDQPSVLRDVPDCQLCISLRNTQYITYLHCIVYRYLYSASHTINYLIALYCIVYRYLYSILTS